MKTLISTLLILLTVLAIFLIGKNIYERQRSQDVVSDIRLIRDSVSIETPKVQEDETELDPEATIKEVIPSQDRPHPIDLPIVSNKDMPLIESIDNYVGWITIDNTRIDYPVVKADDNDYYLNHGYDLKENVAGAIFMDRRNLGNTFDRHTIIYGHYMKNGTMFTDLNLYLEEDFYKKNPIIRFRDLYQTYEYEVIAAYYVSADDYTLAFDINEASLQTFESKSLFPMTYDYKDTDRFLTLSTCNYLLNNGRMILHAVMK